jgi:hypothetical protein
MEGKNFVLKKIWPLYTYLFHKNIPQGAATTVYCAVSKDLNGLGGLYFSDCNIATPLEIANDKEVSKKLFDLSENLTKVYVKKIYKLFIVS